MGDRVRMIYVKVDPQAKLDEVILQCNCYWPSGIRSAWRRQILRHYPAGHHRTREATTAAFRTCWPGWQRFRWWWGIGIMNIIWSASRTHALRSASARRSAPPQCIRLQFPRGAPAQLVGGLIGVLLAWAALAFSKIGACARGRANSILLAFALFGGSGYLLGYYRPKGCPPRSIRRCGTNIIDTGDH